MSDQEILPPEWWYCETCGHLNKMIGVPCEKCNPPRNLPKAERERASHALLGAVSARKESL